MRLSYGTPCMWYTLLNVAKRKGELYLDTLNCITQNKAFLARLEKGKLVFCGFKEEQKIFLLYIFRAFLSSYNAHETTLPPKKLIQPFVCAAYYTHVTFNLLLQGYFIRMKIFTGSKLVSVYVYTTIYILMS